MAADKHRMGELHEEFLAQLNDGVKSKASGSQWTDPGDGRNNRLTDPFAFCWDGKSTCTEGITVTRAMIAKIREQAGGERPQIGLRFYATQRLDEVSEDWIAIPAADFAELLAAVRNPPEIIQAVPPEVQPPSATAGARAGTQAVELATADGEMPLPPVPAPRAQDMDWVPEGMPPRSLWPCTVIDLWHTAGSGMSKRGYHVSADGRMKAFQVRDVRIESEMASQARLIVDDVQVRRGELRIDGQLRVRVGGA